MNSNHWDIGSQKDGGKPSKAWETKDTILEDGDLHKMTYNELWDNLLTYEYNHINRHNKEEKKTTAFSVASLEEEEKNMDEEDSKGMTHINR